jgi:predicted dehydrogenase
MSRIRVIQVGVGGMGNTWLRTVKASDEVEYAAWVDVSAEVLQKQCAAYGFDAAHCYTSLNQALAAEKADGLINVTPPQFHEQTCCAAFEAGLPVLSEKPLADTLDAARRVVACAERTGRVFMVAQNYRYRECIRTLHNLVASGRYGAPGQVHIAFYKGPHFGGFREEMPYPLIIDMSIHHFDMMRYILGADPVNVMGRSWNPYWSWFKGDASAELHFAFTQGLQVVYHGSWCATGDETPWNADWHIECAKGVIVLRNDLVYEAATGEALKPVTLDPMERTAQAYLLHEFCQALTQGVTPATNGRDNLKSLGMVFGAVEAVSTGKMVTL